MSFFGPISATYEPGEPPVSGVKFLKSSKVVGRDPIVLIK